VRRKLLVTSESCLLSWSASSTASSQDVLRSEAKAPRKTRGGRVAIDDSYGTGGGQKPSQCLYPTKRQYPEDHMFKIYSVTTPKT
jgi:hypothetical protein